MKAVNLIPRDSRSGGGLTPTLGRLGAAHVLIGLLVVALAAVTAYVLTNNTVNARKAKLAGLQQQVTRMQAQVTRLNKYEQFEKLAQARASTVRQIASTRFDWHRALSDLSKVVPSDTTLQSLSATVSPGGSGGSGLRGDINAPALEMSGCTGSQDEVAQLMSRLRVINDVTRVSLESSTKGGGTAGPSSGTSGSSSGPCGNGPTFNMVVFFAPQAGLTGGASSITGAAK